MVVISRRRVLQSVPVSLAAVALPAGTAGAAVKAPTNPLSRSRWTPLVGSTFTAASASTSWSARLASIDDLPGSPGSDRRYALRFTSTSSRPEETYSLSRPGFSATPLHLVCGTTGRTWTAVVNRL